MEPNNDSRLYIANVFTIVIIIMKKPQVLPILFYFGYLYFYNYVVRNKTCKIT